MTRKLAVAAIVVLAFAAILNADDRLDMRRDPVVRAMDKTAGAVVNISTEKVVQRNFFGDIGQFEDPFGVLRQFNRPEIANSLGSGGIFTPDGFIFTNAHVVDRASKIMVTLSNGTQFPAELVNVDLATDVAVVKISSPKPLPYLVLGRSDDLMVGEKAIAVGNPFGLSNTVTTGVISATHRDVIIENRVAFKDFLQTDALINPGNSGGPLLNIFGEVIGVNSAMRANAQGIGFAIPVDRVKKSLASLMDYRKLRRMRLGLDFEEKYTGTGPESTLVVKSVDAAGPADKAGIKAGDLVTSVGGKNVSSLVAFMAAVLTIDGDSLPFALDRNGRSVGAEVAATEIPKPDGAKLAQTLLGLTVQQMDRSLARSVGIDIDKGILIADVRPGSAAAGKGLAAGDVILQVNESLTPDLDSFASVLETAQNADTVYLVVLRREGLAYYRFVVEVPIRAVEKS